MLVHQPIGIVFRHQSQPAPMFFRRGESRSVGIKFGNLNGIIGLKHLKRFGTKVTVELGTGQLDSDHLDTVKSFGNGQTDRLIIHTQQHRVFPADPKDTASVRVSDPNHVTLDLADLLGFERFDSRISGNKGMERIIGKQQHQLRRKTQDRPGESQCHCCIEMDILKESFECPVHRGGTM
jgi:hypothetical protein